MSTLKREDGVVFVLQPYRETLAIKNTSLLRKEIKYLAEAHGSFVRLFKSESGEYEGVFSQEAGVLFGESVWAHFEKPRDLIYCEVIDREERQALLVIVREGKLYLDGKFSFDHLNEEISGLLSEINYKYQIYVYGDVPVDFDQTSVQTLNKLPESLFARLNAEEHFSLLALEQALEEHNLAQKKSSLVALTTLCLIALLSLWWYAKLQQPTTAQNVNPYEQYELALQSPDPGTQLSALTNDMDEVQTLAGWIPDSFTYNGQTAQVAIHSMGGTATQLITDAQKLNMNANFSSNGASITFVTNMNARAAPDHIANTQQIIALIIDRMMQVLPGSSVKLGNTTVNEVFTQTQVTISFNNISPEILQLIGSSLENLPVRLSNVTATIKNGLFSGSLQLAVVGN